MRSWAIALIGLLVLVPAASGLVQTHGFPFRQGPGPWAQLACEVLIQSSSMHRCELEGRVGGADTFRMDVVGSATAMVWGDLLLGTRAVALIGTTICQGSCVVRFPTTTGEVLFVVDITGTPNTFVHAGVGAGMDLPVNTPLGRVLV